jgi:hypothetical protein
MTSVTEGRIFGLLAVAQPNLLLFRECEFLWAKACAFVGTITHGLMTAKTAGTPPVITSFEFEADRFCIEDFGESFHKAGLIREQMPSGKGIYAPFSGWT